MSGVHGIGPYAGGNWLLHISCGFLCQVCPRKLAGQFQTGKAFPACCESLSSTEEVMLNFLKGKGGDRQNVFGVFKSYF